MQMITKLRVMLLKDYNKLNLQHLTNYFKAGCKKKNTGRIGIELEHFLVDKNTKKAVSYYGKNGIEQILEEIADKFQICERENGRLLALGNNDYSISLEPGAQMEISIVPKSCLWEVMEAYKDFLSIVEPVVKKYGYELLSYGYQPSSKAEEIELIPKNRYNIMDDYFQLSGDMGINMMRGTCSLQVNIDYFSEEDFVKKYKLANLLVPIIYLLTDNSPDFQGKKNNENCIRSIIWENVDRKRCQIPAKESFDDFSFAKYGEFVYESLPLFDYKEEITSYTMTNKDYFDDREINQEDIRHMLSMVFPEVRLKQFLEIRTADSLPIEYALSYGAFIKGLFSQKSSVESALKLFKEDKPKDVIIARNAVRKSAYNANVYGQQAKGLIENLFTIAQENSDDKERENLVLLKELAKGSTNLRMMESRVKYGK